MAQIEIALGLHYDGSSCNGCDIEVLATLCPGFDGERFGVVNTAIPSTPTSSSLPAA